MAEKAKDEDLHLGITIDTEELAWFKNSPDAGDPACTCSHCGNVIEDYEIPLRLFKESDGTEARLCETCMDLLIK